MGTFYEFRPGYSEMPIATGNSSAPNDYEFLKYRGPTGNSNLNSGSTDGTGYPSYNEMELGGSVKNTFEPSLYNSGNYEQPTSWLHGNDFNSMAGDLFSSKNIGLGGENSFGNLSLNLDQIKIGDQTMENVLKALDPSISNNNQTSYTSANTGNSFLNGLNLDTSFTSNNKKSNTNFDYFKPTNRSNIIKSHAAQKLNSVSFKHPPTSQFFSSPDESFVNMTLPAMDTSMIFSDSSKKRTSAVASVPNFNNNNNNLQQNIHQTSREKEQFINFALQQYRMLAAMSPEMMGTPDNLDELAGRETFKYWAKLFIEERERQARIVLNMQKALTEALSGSAAKGPNVMAHLGAASGDFELETIGRFADQCRKKSQIISQYFNNKQK